MKRGVRIDEESDSEKWRKINNDILPFVFTRVFFKNKTALGFYLNGLRRSRLLRRNCLQTFIVVAMWSISFVIPMTTTYNYTICSSAKKLYKKWSNASISFMSLRFRQTNKNLGINKWKFFTNASNTSIHPQISLI